MLKGVNEIKFISKSVNANEIPALGQHHMLAPSTDLGQSYNQFGIAQCFGRLSNQVISLLQ